MRAVGDPAAAHCCGDEFPVVEGDLLGLEDSQQMFSAVLSDGKRSVDVFFAAKSKKDFFERSSSKRHFIF